MWSYAQVRTLGQPGQYCVFMSFALTVYQGLILFLQRMFADVYNATQYFRSKSLMERLSLSEIVIGDVVLAECYCIRTPEVAGGRPVRSASWRVWFELSAISLLVKSPRLPFPYVQDSFSGCL